MAEAEAATRIRQKYLAALESDEWHLLPGEVVGRGFLRNYATFLGLEPNEVVERRRTVADPTLAAVLASTSAGSAAARPQRGLSPTRGRPARGRRGHGDARVASWPYLHRARLAAGCDHHLVWWEPLTSLAMATADGVQALFARTPAPIVHNPRPPTSPSSTRRTWPPATPAARTTPCCCATRGRGAGQR
ncbi:MAG: helix-turn-helix transcriptional regulator [Caldilineaceae bacterium]